MEYKCPQCGETKNLHYNLDYTKQTRPILDVLCNECGEFFGEKNEVVLYKNDYRSKHWADVLNWLKIVVESCKTQQQSDTCMRLLQNFERTYESQIGVSDCMKYLKPLKHKLWDNFELPPVKNSKKIFL